MAELVEHPEPSWLSAAVDQRVAFMVDKTAGAEFPPGAILATPLTEPREGQSFEDWDRSCDNCGRLVPQGEVLESGTCTRQVEGHRVVVTFGSCQTCWDD